MLKGTFAAPSTPGKFSKTHLVGRGGVGLLLLRRGGLVLGWTTRTHMKHTAVMRAGLRSLRSRWSQAHTYSPPSLPLRCLRNKAMAVPMAASSTMAPMIPPMMLPVVGPFPGRRVPAEKQRNAQGSSGESNNRDGVGLGFRGEYLDF